MGFVIQSFQEPQRVEFDPGNLSHLEAFVWLHAHGRQHPTLRFRFDPTKYADAHTMMIDKILKHALPGKVLNKVYLQVKERTCKVRLVSSVEDSAVSLRPVGKHQTWDNSEEFYFRSRS